MAMKRCKIMALGVLSRLQVVEVPHILAGHQVQFYPLPDSDEKAFFNVRNLRIEGAIIEQPGPDGRVKLRIFNHGEQDVRIPAYTPCAQYEIDPVLAPHADMTMEEIAQVAPIGNSPVMLSKADLGRIAKPWAEVVVQMKTDPEADKAWGWVLEMWAYTVTAYKVGVKHHLYPELAAQQPWDQELKDFYILHYTYGCDYTRDGVFTPGKIGEWRFDKRSYMGRAPPRNLAPPPRAAPALVHTLVAYINEATSALPWP